MKSIKFLFMFALVAISLLTAKAQVSSDINATGLFRTKYFKNQVWDVQRSPSYPVANQDWTLSGLKSALDATGANIDWGVGRYLMFAGDVDKSNNAKSLVDDVYNVGTQYNISLKLFESNGKLVKVVSKYGQIMGMGPQAFMYEEEGQYGTFFTAIAINPSSVIKYKPSMAFITKRSELIKGNAEFMSGKLATNPTELPKVNTETDSPELIKINTTTSFFTTKYTKDKVCNVQREPEFPTAGKDWTLIKTGAPFDFTGAPIDWGVNRYLMFVAKVDKSTNYKLLEDDVYKTGLKYSVSLQLFESNGKLVKVISAYGDIIGTDEQNFVYNSENRFATYFAATTINSTNIKYKPTLKIVTKLSELLKPNEVSSPSELPKVNAETSFFTTKYTKDKAWDVQRSPAFPVTNQDWTLSQLQSAKDAKRVTIDWGNGRYLMFVADANNVNVANSLTDDVYKIGTKYNISLQLFESNGTLVKVVSKWGKVRGIGSQGFLYEAEGDVGTFFTSTTVTATSVIKYKPSLAEVTKLSELVKYFVTNNPPIEQPSTTIAIGYYTLTSRNSGKLLDVLDASKLDGAKIQQWKLNGNIAQHWKIEPVKDAPGYYILTARCSDKALDVNESSKLDGAKVQQWTRHGQANQQWKIDPVQGAPGYYTLTSKCSGKVLDVNAASKLDGEKVQQWAPNGGTNQQWKLDMVK